MSVLLGKRFLFAMFLVLAHDYAIAQIALLALSVLAVGMLMVCLKPYAETKNLIVNVLNDVLITG